MAELQFESESESINAAHDSDNEVSVPLTPRSKIKAMLARVDDDEESAAPISAPSRLANFLKGPSAPQHDQNDYDEPLATSSSESESDNNESDVPVVTKKPRGKLAARLAQQGAAHSDQDLSSSDQSPSSKSTPLVLNRKLLKRKRDRKPVESAHVDLGDSSPEPTAPPATQHEEVNLSKADRFAALVARKRAEREAKEAEADAQRTARLEKQKALQVPIEAETSDSEAEHSIQKTKLNLTQEKQDRPARKASKKALLEMEREQQRISRNMQLTHQAKTRKKISKDSFLAKFGVMKAIPIPPQTGLSAQASSSRSSSPNKVFDESSTKPATPPSSPPNASPLKKPQAEPFYMANYQVIDLDDDPPLPMLDNFIQEAATIADTGKGKGKAPLSPEPAKAAINRATIRESVRRAELSEHRKSVARQRRASTASDDDDLEIVKPVVLKKKSTASDILKNVSPDRQQQLRSIQKLRLLANLENVESKSALRHAVEAAAMKRDLQTKAKRQAAAERAERVESLRARGVVIETQEERDKNQLQIEDMLEKARQEADEIAKREKAAAKGEAVDDGLSSDEDGDYVDEQSVADKEEQELELSGSEDEAEVESEAADGVEEEVGDDASGEEDEGEGEDIGVEVESADESEDENPEADADEMAAFVNDESESEASETIEVTGSAPTRRRNNKTIILDDDEDDDASPVQITQMRVDAAPEIVQQAAPGMPFNPFAMAGAAPAPMGLTQAFAATMADTQLDDNDGEDDDDQGLPSRPPSPIALPTIVSPMKDIDNAPDFVLQSPIGAQTSKVSASIDEITEMPEATQDVGFRQETPLARRFVSQMPASIDTVIIQEAMNVEPELEKEQPEPGRKGRLMRRAVVADDGEDEEATIAVDEQGSQKMAPTAFDAMAKAARRQKRRDEFIKKRSKAGEMVHEQAEESEDEYAGLGGASDDDSDGEMDEATKEMLDDRNIDVDESKLAAFHADKERQDDEAGISRLYNDITKGNLRRKRNANEFDLSDSDDDIEARRRIKQQEFARVRKALLQDEHVGKIAENPKNQAFLRAIEDRDEDVESWDFQETEDDSRPESQSQMMPPPPPPQLSQLVAEPESQDTPSPRETGPAVIPDSQTIDLNTRPALKEMPSAVLNLFPRNARRTAPKLVDNRPTTIEQIRQSVSFLVEDSQKDIHLDPSSDVSDAENEAPSYERVMANFAASRTASTSSVIVDRVQQRIDANTSTAEPSRMAFHTGSGSQGMGFRVPSLLRRATSNLGSIIEPALSRQLSRSDSQSSASSSRRSSVIASTERAAGGATAGDFVRKGGTKKSSVSYFARENERRKKVEEIEKKRIAEQRKFVDSRRGVFVGLHTASFE